MLDSHEDQLDAQELKMRGDQYRDTGEWEQAIALYSAAVEHQRDFWQAHANLAIAFGETNNYASAVSHAEEAILHGPPIAELHANLGEMLRRSEAYPEAKLAYNKAIEMNPRLVSAYYNLGQLYCLTNEYRSAMDVLGKAIELHGKNATFYNQLGVAQRNLQQFDQAIASFNQALRLDSASVEALCNLATVMKDQGRFNESILLFKDVLALDPEHIYAHNNLCDALLLQGNFKEGWSEYEWRWRAGARRPKDALPQPYWAGNSLIGKTLFIFAEQGIGDEIMFSSCIPDLLKMEHGQYIVECDSRLVPLFQRSFPGIEVHKTEPKGDLNWLRDYPDLDYQLPMGDLLCHLRDSFTSFPRHSSYLVPREDLVEVWRERYRQLGAGPKIGISWRGGAKFNTINKRSIPLIRWLSLLDCGAHFINLQYGDSSEELSQLEQETAVCIHDWDDADPLHDLDNFAAQIAALDLVISIDNSTVHMAGALGKETWVLLPAVPDWRWFTDRDDTPWYQSLRLFRQGDVGDWEEVLVNIREALRIWCAKSHVSNTITP